MSDVILAIDQGTTGSTAVLIDTGLNVLAKVNQEFDQIYPQPGWVEHDPEAIWDSVEGCVAAAIEQAGIAASDIAAIGITNQRETSVVWEKDGGARDPQRNRVAVPQDQGHLRRAQGRGPRVHGAGPHRTGPRSVLLGHEVRLDPRSRRRSQRPRGPPGGSSSGRSTATSRGV